MNKRLAKIISMLLCLVMLVGAFTMLPTTARAAGTEVTRSQWLQALTQTFEMSVEEDNYPDNYFSDLSSDSEYYYDMLLAVEFGLVDIPAGGELRPDDPATREFAAKTLNFCLGYQLGENASYTFSEASTVDHPDDIQIAIDRGWFALSGKSFLPNQPITAAEMETMLADAKTVLAKGTDDGSEDTYEFADHVLVIPQGSIAYENEQGQIVLEYNDIPLSVGDTFAVTTEIFPQTYTADKIVTEGSKTVITVTEVPLAETLLSMHTSGSAVGDLADVEPAEGVDMVYVLEDNTRTRTIDGSKPVKELIFPIEIGGLKVYVELTKLYVDYYVDAHGGDLDAVVTLRGDVYFSCTVPFGVSVGEFSDIMELCSLPVAGIGSLSAYMDISLDGSATAVYSGSFMGGVSYESPFGFRIIHSFQKKSFTINVEAILNASMNVSLAADKIPFITARCTATIGTKCLFDFDYRGEDATPKTCMHTDAWVYAHLYTYASVGYKKISESYSNMLTLFDRNNSPLRSVTHFEDGIMVSHCTIDTDYTRYGRYYTSPSSRYANGGGSSVASSSVESSPVFTYTLNEVSKAVITGYGGKTAALSIPSTIDGYTVVGIGDNALKGKSLTSVVLPATVTYIGENAFQNCSSLREISLPDGLVSIGEDAFSGCSNLRVLYLPDMVTSIETSAFYNCTSLSKVVLPKNLETIGALAFYNCDKLTAIEIPKALKKTTDTIAFGGIVVGPFYDCDGLKTVTFEEGTTAIANGLFANCTGLEEIIIPDTVTTIGSIAFEYCKNLESVQLSSALTKIGSSAFWYCTSLAKVEIPNAVTEIVGSAFYNCTSLSKVVLPKNLETMGAYAFYNCDKLKTIEIPKALKRTTDVMASGGWYVYGPFYDCDGLKTATFEDGTTAIAIGLFANCTGLEEIVIPDTVTTIGNKAFQGCSSLIEIVIPNTVTSIGGSVFINCSSLVTAKWPDSLPTIPSYMFSGCSALTDLTIPDNLSSIESYAFDSCSALPELKLPTAVKRIGDFCFQNCTALAKIGLSDGITSIGKNSFYNCDTLVDVTLPDTVTSLGKSCFWGCDLLEAVKLSSALSIIPESCFQQCIALKEVAIPRFVTTIEKNAFNACTKLEKVIIPREVVTIGTTAFSYPDRMTIYGISGTYAETYANENDFPFVDSPEGATSATLNTKQLTLNKGASETLVLTVTPETYTDAVTWKSSDTSIVTVSDRGVVKAIAVGTATIKVNVGSKSASCKVTVVQPVTSISLNKTSLSMDALQTFALTATAKPDNAYNKTIIWSSSDETVATVDENGLVTALKKGSATITAAAQDGSGVTRKCTVTVNNSAHIVNRLSQFESPHNYPDNCTDFWVFTVAGEEKLQVTFDDRTNIEEDFDYLKIFDGSGNLIGEYTGTTLAGQTVEVSGDTVRIQLISDEGGNEWGFKVTDLGVDIPNEAEGACGANALWELDLDTGELMIFGSGAMENYTSAEDTPWYEFRDSIRTVVIGDRITAIGNHAFDGCGKLTTVFVPTSVTSIGDHAFANCGALKTVDYVGEKAAWDNIDAGTGNTALSNTVSTEAAEQKPVKEVEIDTSKKDLEITVNRCANTFEQIMVGIYDQNGKMVDALLISYDGLAETVTTQLPQQYKSGYIIKTFCTDTDAAPMYQAQVHG